MQLIGGVGLVSLTGKVTEVGLVPILTGEEDAACEADLDPAGNRSKLSVWMQIPNGRTDEVITDTERLEGIRTLPKQSNHVPDG